MGYDWLNDGGQFRRGYDWLSDGGQFRRGYDWLGDGGQFRREYMIGWMMDSFGQVLVSHSR